jgi:hypothetical protein
LVSLGWKDQLVDVGNERIAADIGCSVRALSAHYNLLEDRGLVQGRRAFKQHRRIKLIDVGGVGYTKNELQCKLDKRHEGMRGRVEWA